MANKRKGTKRRKYSLKERREYHNEAYGLSSSDSERNYHAGYCHGVLGNPEQYLHGIDGSDTAAFKKGYNRGLKALKTSERIKF